MFLVGAIFQIWRNSPIDTYIYVVVAILVAIAGWNKPVLNGFRPMKFNLAITLLLACSAIFLAFPIHTWVVTLFYLFLALVPLRVAWFADRDSHEKLDTGFRRASKMWFFIGVATCICELGNYFLADITHDDRTYPTLTVLADPVLADRVGKIFFILLWLFAGVGLFKVSSKK